MAKSKLQKLTDLLLKRARFTINALPEHVSVRGNALASVRVDPMAIRLTMLGAS